MRLVIIESPFRADTIERQNTNITYALLAVRDSILRGESPHASHLLYPGALNDTNPGERDLGIRCGYAWWRAASTVCFYTDLGWSEGMLKAKRRAKTMSIKIEERSICGSGSAINGDGTTDSSKTPSQTD